MTVEIWRAQLLLPSFEEVPRSARARPTNTERDMYVLSSLGHLLGHLLVPNRPEGMDTANNSSSSRISERPRKSKLKYRNQVRDAGLATRDTSLRLYAVWFRCEESYVFFVEDNSYFWGSSAVHGLPKTAAS